LNDGLIEPTETFQVTLSNPTGGAVLGPRTTATVRVIDNDKGLAFEFSNYWAREDEGSVLIGVVRSDDGNFPITVDVISSDGTAKAGLDYIGVTNTLSFASGETVKLFAVPIPKDGLREPNETFRLNLANGTGVGLGSPRTATITILDNDPGVQFTANLLWVQETEGAVQLTVTRGNGLQLDSFTLDYATTNGTATAGSDYTETKGTLAFAAGEMTKSFVVPILNDGVAEKDEQFKVVLSNPTGGMVLGAATNVAATVTVCDVTEMLPHRFDSVQVSPEGLVSLTLGGGFTPGLGVSNRFQPYFDIYPVEVSTNFVDWTPLTWVVRTNAATNQLTFIDPEAKAFRQRFYRTPATIFVASQRVPSGPYPVGITDRTIKDDSRRNRYRISTNGSFPITIWYPAERRPGQWPTARDPEPLARDPRILQGVIDLAPYLRSYAVRNAPFAAGLVGLPVVFWSHGYPDMRNDGQEWAEHLASHGYVVVGVDHFDASFVVYPDGTYFYTNDSDLTGRDLSVQLLQDRVRDFVVALDEMARWNQNDDLFAGRLNVQNAAAMGWSYGGGAAAEFCRVDPRGRAAVVLEGYFQNADALLAAGLSRPVLSIYADPINVPGSELLLFNKLKQDAVWFQIRGTEHGNFATWYWWFTSKRLDRSREAARTITDYTLWFLNKYLKGSKDPMPQPVSYPQVFNFKQK
jgi:dienelactone hydrolase